MSTLLPGRQGRGVLSAFAAYFCWGILALYWRPLAHVPPLQIMCHRIVWSALFMVGVLTIRQRWSWAFVMVRRPEKMRVYALSSAALSFNWLLYIWAVNAGHVIECSLGSFMTPLVNVMFGCLVLGERLEPRQKLAILLALLGVLWLTFQSGTLPWVALGLAISFGIYGLLRKKAQLPSLEGVALESFLMAPLALAFLVWCAIKGVGSFGHAGLLENALLFGSGVVTVVPLLLFVKAARCLKLSTIGVIQYISPTLQLVLGVWFFHESFGRVRVVGFALIWAGLIVYALGSVKILLRRRLAV
jgi:chloramphenicol-sensitive protein RarD